MKAVCPRRLGPLLFVTLFFALLSAPLVDGLVGMVKPSKKQGENLWLAPLPDAPASLSAWVRYPRALEAYLTDHAGLRKPMLKANSQLHFHLFRESSSPRVAFGRHGRLFMTAHDGAPPYSLIHEVCGIGVTSEAIGAAERTIVHLLARMDALVPVSVFVLVPTAPVLYRDDLPPWLGRQCTGTPPAASVAAALEQDGRLLGRVFYPLAAMRSVAPPDEAIPKPNFHWDGPGPARVVAAIAERGLGRRESFDMPTRRRVFGSDLADLTPGLDLTYEATVPDLAAAGIDDCQGPACAPRLGEAAGPLLVHRYRASRAAPGRLLLIGDSYAAAAGPWFTQYFREVLALSTNNLRYLPAERRRPLLSMLESDPPDAVVFLYHDGGLFHVAEQLSIPLWGKD